MCNLYSMTATVDEMRRIFGSFDGDTSNLSPFDEIYPGYSAPVLRRRDDGGMKLEMMQWGFPGPQAAGGRPVTNVRNLASPFWRNARKAKAWFRLSSEQHPLFAFAGIWRPGENGPFMAFLTCEANHTVGAVHP